MHKTLISNIVVGVSLCATATAAAAQSAVSESQARDDVDAEETIVVTGYRGVAEPIQVTKRQSDAIVDTLTQGEIEKLPDRSLAEVLDRVVGVSSDRGYGGSQPRTVTLRGFDARYNSMTVDGNVIWNSSRNNRGTQLDVFPASVINEINVFKTVTPDMDANSIGGHLQLRTLRAFDGGTGSYLKARAAYGIYQQHDLPDDGRPSFRADAAGKFTFGPERQFGVVLGAEYQRHEYYDKVDEVTGYAQVGGIDVLNGYIYRGIFQARSQRFAAYGKLETRQEDKYYAFLSASYFDDDMSQTFNRGGVYTAASGVTDARQGTGDFASGTGETYFEDYGLHRRTLLLGSGLDYRIGDRTSVNLRAGYTDYDHDEVLARSERFQIGGLSGSYDIGHSIPDANFASASEALRSDAANWRHRTKKAAFSQPMPHEDNVYNAGAEINMNGQESARGFGLRAGVQWRRLDRAFNQTTDTYTLPSGVDYRLSDVLAPRGAAPGVDGIGPVFIDRDAYWQYIMAHADFGTDDALTTDYRLKEDVAAGHATALFATDSLRILAGFRIEKTRFVNSTANVQGGAIVPEVRRFHYTEFLPNVQLAFEPASGLKLRAAFTETLARPDFSDFANGLTISFNTEGVEVISGANPFLEPRKARNYDASVEYYFGGGYAALGVFRKDLRNETFRQRRDTFDQNGALTRIETIPLNSGSASVQGIELSFVKEKFDALPGFLANFGLNANYTFLDGKWNVIFTDGSTRTVNGLRNQPRWLANLILSYNQGRFGANLGYRLRGRTFTGSFGTTAATDLWIDDYQRLDAQASFKLSGNAKIFAEAKNITSSYWVEETGILGTALSTSANQGRSYWFGITYKM